MIDGIVQALNDVVWLGPVGASPTDFVRLLVVPVFGWTAYRDVKTRRVPNRTWIPLVVLGVALLAGDAWLAYAESAVAFQNLAIRAGLSIGFVVPLAYVFWRIGGFGGADAKALMVLALLFPVYPSYLFRPPVSEVWLWGSMPHVRAGIAVFAFTVLTDGVLVGIVYPLGVTLRNLAAGRIAPVMFIGRPVPVDEIPETYGRLLETPEGTTRGGLDVDALRMYLQWRGATLAELRADPDRFRDPTSLPAEFNPPGDGAIADGGRPVEDRDAATDGGEPIDADDEGEDGGKPVDDEAGDEGTDADDSLVDPDLFGVGDDGDEGTISDDPDESRSPHGSSGTDSVAPGASPTAVDDPWGADAFVEDVGNAYGTTADDLRAGLEVLVRQDDVWVSPGLPFLVPLFLGLLTAITYGDLLFGALQALGVV